MGALTTDVVAVLNERAADAAAGRLVSKFAAAGKTSGDAFTQAMEAEVQRTNLAMDSIRNSLEQRLSDSGGRAGRGFGRSFGSELASAIPGVSGFSSAMAGYEGAAGKTGALAGRALGMAFTTAAAGLIGAAGYTLFKGFERYEAIDTARNRLENLNRTMTQLGRPAYDIKAVMDTVNNAVLDTPIALDKAFSLAPRALATNSGDLKRFMTVAADAAVSVNGDIESIGSALLKVANTGKVSMDELQNELVNIPILPMMQQQLHVSGAELQKMISDGKVGLEDLMRAMEATTGGMAKSAGETLAGAIDQANTAVARLGANLLGAAFGKPTDDANGLKDAIKAITDRLNEVNAWVTAHQAQIRHYFEEGVDAAKTLASAIGTVMEWIDKIPGGITTVVVAFGAWKAIQGVIGLTTALTTVSTMLKTTLPASAMAGAAGISAALARVVPPAWLAYLVGKQNPLDPGNGIPLPDGSMAPDIRDPNFNMRDEANKIADQMGKPHATNEVNGRTYSGGGGTFDVIPAWQNPGEWQAQVRPNPARREGLAPFSLDGPAGPAGGPILPAPGLADDGSGGGKGPRLPSAPVIPYDMALPPSIPGMPQDASVFGAESSFLDARHKLAEKRARVVQLEGAANATEEDRLNARNEVAEAERDLQAAEMRMGEARASQFEKLTKQTQQHVKDLGDIGASIDKDFGISKGLAGIAENITKFVANLAAAPLLGQLQAVSQSNPSQGGYGVMGILGARGALGEQYTGIDYSRQAATLGPAALQYGGGNVGAMMALAQAASGNVKYGPASDMVNGLADCSGSISDLVETLQTGKSSPARLFDTTAFASDESAAKLGFRPGYQPGALNVGVTPLPGQSGHMAATLPNMVNFEGGGQTGGGAQYGGSAAGALDPQFSKHYYMPVGPSIPPGPTAPTVLPDSVIHSPENTDPALTPAAPSLAGVPSIPGGMMRGVGAPQSAPFADRQYGGVEPASGTGKGGVGMDGGGALGMAMQAGGMALDAMAPGAGQAAQTGVKLINRTIEYGSQAIGIGVQGALDTFLPTGGSELASRNWLTRIVGGLAGAAPALPNMAGKGSKTAKDVANIDPAAAAKGEVVPQNNTTNINVDATNREARGIANEIDWHDGNRNLGPGM